MALPWKKQEFSRLPMRPSDVPQSVDQSTDSAMYRIDPRTSGMELRLDPRPNDQTDRPGARHLRPTRQSKTNGQARINFERAEFDSTRNFSLLNHLVRTACTGDRTDGLIGHFDHFMNFEHLNFSKARILHLSEDLGRAWSSLVHETYPTDHTDSPTYVVLLTAVHTSGYIEPGQD
ncbi:hypothetical protein F2Q69_00013058 [Brassica cretica]|uniref:Uncharacterized protein n=1 Tax=Brassica cretica TaxID=69181 RepID=A0A8S9QR21_BRACR|nr:hypothetical protein F2Q69_00013058 [Brassica cretica]